MVEIQPYEFKKKTNIEEHNDIVSKVNEIVDVINDTQMDTINTRLTAVEGDVTALETEVSTINNELDTKADKTEIPDTSAFATKTEVDAVDTKVDAIDSQLDSMHTEIDGLLKEIVDGVIMTSNAHGTVQVQINHEDGSNDISAPIDLGLVEEGGIVLQSGTTDRSFKLIVTLTDGTSWQTNDFVIPEGGGTEVSVTNISIAQGTGADKIQVKIGLSDGSTISSNDWTVVTPSEFSALGTRVTTAEGNITRNTGDISDLDTRVQALEDSPGYALKPATATTLGGVKIGTGITVQSDGTIAVDLTPTVSVNDEVSPPQITVSINGNSSTANLPEGSSGEWINCTKEEFYAAWQSRNIDGRILVQGSIFNGTRNWIIDFHLYPNKVIAYSGLIEPSSNNTTTFQNINLYGFFTRSDSKTLFGSCLRLNEDGNTGGEAQSLESFIKGYAYKPGHLPQST